MKTVALAGGVGGAKLVDGLASVLSPDELTIIVNTGDDFDHFGLRICPDLDTVCYTLAGLADPRTGWGRDGESTRVLDEIRRLGGPDWFQLGDLDLATHLERTRRLECGETISDITRDFCLSWGIRHCVLPATNDDVPTIVKTHECGDLSFQEYFVHRKCEPTVQGFEFRRIKNAKPATGVLEAIDAADLVVICPSNPWVSIDPILAIPGLRDAVREKSVVAVSPIVQGKTLKGPAAKMYKELGFSPSALEVARHYRDILNLMICDESDLMECEETHRWGIISIGKQIIMTSRDDRVRLAEEVLRAAYRLMED